MSEQSTDRKVENVIIIGSGPAGYTAAIYTSRANLEPLMFEGYFSGGQLMLTTDVENYPGFPSGVMGPDFMMDLRKQAERFGSKLVSRDVTKVDFSQQPYRVEVEKEVYFAHTVIISTGASAKMLNLESEKRLMGHGVSTCATCDGAFFRNKVVAVVGGGDSAMEEANFLTRFASKVYVMHRRDHLRASKIMQDRAMANPKVEFLWHTVIDEVLGENKVSGVKLRNVQTGETSELALDGVFVAIGHTPNTWLFKDTLEMDEVGYLKVDYPSSRTNLPGVFAAGDVHDPVYRQAITAAGAGCRAALDAERYLEAQGHHG
ncbi:MAG TPA: thioredoxin-disulfide reductase [Candidatus Obscuribacterales bacterium]